MYDVGAITREIQTSFGLFDRTPEQVLDGTPNKATPEGLRTLLDALHVVTDDIRKARRRVGIQFAHEDKFDADLLRWRGRLGAYDDAVNAAPAGDRQAVLWSVTAPLLLGFFGGEGGKLPQQPIDAVTPFSLSNQLNVSEDAQQRAWDLFLDDLVENAKSVARAGEDIAKAVAVVAVAIVAASILRR